MTKYEKGKIVRGTVTGIEDYGIFVMFDEFYSGLIHISEISHSFVKDVNNYVKIGDNIYTEIIGVDDKSFHLNLSIKNINYKKTYKHRPKKIIETKSGFSSLQQKLPIWIEESVKKYQNTIDKHH